MGLLRTFQAGDLASTSAFGTSPSTSLANAPQAPAHLPYASVSAPNPLLPLHAAAVDAIPSASLETWDSCKIPPLSCATALDDSARLVLSEGSASASAMAVDCSRLTRQ